MSEVYTMQSDPTRAETRQLAVARRLAQAIAERKLEVHYQPQVDILQRRLVSLEALCRWRDSELDWVSPNEFIAVAEAKGLIADLGRLMLHAVLADLPVLRTRIPGVRVAINVSGLELTQVDFADQFIRVVKENNSADFQHLEIEITESIFHHDLRTVQNHVQKLKAHGVSFAIDDFGTGQSSLSRLHTLPFDKIKMDKSFVRGIDDPMVRAIVKGMAALTRSFQRTLVVEGVETQAQLHALRRCGCRIMQGYLLGRPQPLAMWLQDGLEESWEI